MSDRFDRSPKRPRSGFDAPESGETRNPSRNHYNRDERLERLSSETRSIVAGGAPKKSWWKNLFFILLAVEFLLVGLFAWYLPLSVDRRARRIESGIVFSVSAFNLDSDVYASLKMRRLEDTGEASAAGVNAEVSVRFFAGEASTEVLVDLPPPLGEDRYLRGVLPGGVAAETLRAEIRFGELEFNLTCPVRSEG